MSLVRALRTRLARLLARLARKVDGASADGSTVPASDALEALRLRYPGAPDHWLELVAARADASASVSTNSAELGGEREHVQFHSAGAAKAHERAQFNLARRNAESGPQAPNSPVISRPSPMARFAHGERRTRASARFRSSPQSGARHPRLTTFPLVEWHEPDRPEKRAFAWARKLRVRSVSKFPPALPLKAVRDAPVFSAEAVRVRPAAPRFNVAAASVRDPDASAVPLPQEGRPLRSEWQGQPGADRDRANNRPDFDFKSPTPRRPEQLNWMTEAHSRVPRDFDFQSPTNPWPELPTLDKDDQLSPNDPSENARLAHEQMGGRWSE